MAVAFRSASAITKTTGSVATPAAPAGVVTGDALYAVQTQDSIGSPAAMTAPAGWTEQYSAAPGPGSPSIKVWARAADGTQTYSFTHASNADCSVAVLCLTGADPGAALTVAASHGISSHTAPSTTGAVDGLLICAFVAHQDTGIIPSYTPPSGMTERTESAASGGWVAMSTATVATTSTAATGTKTATCSRPYECSALSFVIEPGSSDTPVSSDDAGTGSDAAAVDTTATQADTGVAIDALALTVDLAPVTDSATGVDTPTLQQQYALDESGTGTDTLDVTAIEYRELDDAGLGSDAILVDIPDLFYLDDAGIGSDTADYESTSDDSFEFGVGTDTALIARTSSTTDEGIGSDEPIVLRQSDSTDAGLGSETIAVTQFTIVVDGGTGTDTVTDLFRVSSTTDSGVGTDTIPVVGPIFGDFGTGTDVVSVVDIPFTQILPLKSGPIYDLVVVARIPQAVGPPSFIEIDPIEWKGLTYVNTLSQAQDLSASCLLSSVTESVLQRLRSLHSQATELWLYRNGKIVFAGPLVGWQTAGENLTLSCKGLLSYLRLMVVQTDLRFVNVDQFTIVKGLIDQWQNLEHGNYGIDTTTVGESGTPREVTYLRDELHNVGKLVTDLGISANGYDAEIDPASRKLQLWAPRKGVDRSEGEDAIVIDARNVTSADILCSVAGGDLASEAYGTATSTGADTALFSVQSNLELRSRFGRCAVSQSFTDVPLQAQLDANVQGLLDARGEALLVPGPRTRVTPDADLTSFGVGDTIAYELGSTLGVSGAFRIRKQSVTVSSTGQESVDLEFV